MRLSFFSILLCLVCFSCEQNACEELNCGEHGVCDEITEACLCDDYYEGDQCADEVRERFIGEWSGFGGCDYNPGSVYNVDFVFTQGLEVNSLKIQSDDILQDFTMTGMLSDNDYNTIEVPLFQAHVGSNDYDGIMIYDETTKTMEMTLNAYVSGVKNVCVFTLSK